MFSSLSSRTRIRSVCVALTWLVVIILLVSGCGAKKPKVYRVGILSGQAVMAVVADGFKAKMAELGYVEGENIIYDVQQTAFDIAAYQSILAKFVADKVDLIVAYPTEAALEAKKATEGTDIPVLFAITFIEDTDLVANVREPGGNVTGVRHPGADLAPRRLEIMLQMVPEAKRILIPYMRGYPSVPIQFEALRPAAEAAGVTLIEAPVGGAAELETDLQARAQAADLDIDAILMLAEPLATTPDSFKVMGKFAYEHHIPIGGSMVLVGDYGSLFGLSPDYMASGKQAAPLADKIFKGTPAGTIPVVSAEGFLKINYPATQEQGVTVPDGLLKQANEVIR